METHAWYAAMVSGLHPATKLRTLSTLPQAQEYTRLVAMPVKHKRLQLKCATHKDLMTPTPALVSIRGLRLYSIRQPYMVYRTQCCPRSEGGEFAVTPTISVSSLLRGRRAVLVPNSL